MRVFIQGMFIPNTNEWWVDRTWTFGDLKSDVVKIATAKTGDPSDFLVRVNHQEADEAAMVCDHVEDGGQVTIGPR